MSHPSSSSRAISVQTAGLVAWLVLCLAAGGVGAFASIDAGVFYANLTQPDWAPPGWLFGPVWTALYTMMSVAAWWIWRVGPSKAVRGALAWFFAQLALNALWSWLFFAWRLGAWAFVEIALLWLLIVITTVAFWRVRPLAGYLLLPYLAWVSFAAVLNFWLWRANPSILG